MLITTGAPCGFREATAIIAQRRAPLTQHPWVPTRGGARSIRHRVILFSLNANAGAALAAAVVQPGAAGLNALAFSERSNVGEGARAEGSCWYDETQGKGFNAGRGGRGESGDGDGDDGACDRGVVFESLDSRILEETLVSTMGRLGLGVNCRSRCGRVGHMQGLCVVRAVSRLGITDK